ncbi:SHOCT domain-containing protein [Halorussus gelatinilyticus]|uniref:SHOCT domain-containing protein n=1 Tax=Halorussus gelatinilyticus TaxID=2937524 RepID=A0A8U0IMG1_9EURY|nr:SHOCT domain-containing protein [Halorussus gelatinilyticus]UPW01384.1 SHOCT domain-containing protein [Halorussus gelatinilyticus]
MRERSVRFEKQTLLAVLSVLTFGFTAFFAVVGLEFLVPTTFVLGFFVVVPLVALLGDALPMVEGETEGVEVGRDSMCYGPIDELRSRYAAGELTDEEFERRLERLLETEDAEVGRSREPVFDRE